VRESDTATAATTAAGIQPELDAKMQLLTSLSRLTACYQSAVTPSALLDDDAACHSRDSEHWHLAAQRLACFRNLPVNSAEIDWEKRARSMLFPS
jgi:hypothetical protein